MKKSFVWASAKFGLLLCFSDDFDVKTRRTRIKRLLSMTSLLPKMLWKLSSTPCKNFALLTVNYYYCLSFDKHIQLAQFSLSTTIRLLSLFYKEPKTLVQGLVCILPRGKLEALTLQILVLMVDYCYVGLMLANYIKGLRVQNLILIFHLV